MTISLQKLLDGTFTAQHLMTPRESLDTTPPDQLAEARSRAREKGFDLIPVEAESRIIGVLPAESADYEPLTDRWLVSQDTSIPTLLQLFVDTDRPGFLVLHGQQVVGLVTPADLNKLPARVYVYNLLAELELNLAALIQDHYKKRLDEIPKVLGEDRWQSIIATHGGLKRGDADVNPIHLLFLEDLLKIVATEAELHSRVGFCTNNQLSQLVRLRNRTVHLTRLLVQRVPRDVRVLNKRLQRALYVLEQLNG